MSLLLIVMLVASIPGLILIPYSITEFDESYQILNAYDWENAVYSPLSSWLAHFWGEAVNWNFIGFRFLGALLIFLALFSTGTYALVNSECRKGIIVVTGIATYFALVFRHPSIGYGWDNWTILSLSLILVAFVSFVKRYSIAKVVLLGFLAAFAALVRIPNVAAGAILLLLLSVWVRLDKMPAERAFKVILTFLISFSGMLIVVVCALYGSISTYFTVLSRNPVYEHSFSDTFIPFVINFFIAGLLVILNVFAYKSVSWVGNNVKTGWWRRAFYGLVMISLLCLIFPFPVYSYKRISLLLLASLYMVLIYIYKNLSYKHSYGFNVRFVVAGIFLISLTSAIGSNGGFWKSLSWSLIPLVGMLVMPVADRGKLRYFYILSGAFFICSILSFYKLSSYDWSGRREDYRIRDPESVFYNSIVSHDTGLRLEKVKEQAMPYLENRYTPIVLREGNSYLWEYMFLAPNRHQRHLFNNWYAFSDEKYVEAVRNDISRQKGPVLVMYMQYKDPDSRSPMYQMLRQNLECVLDVPGYSFWIRPDSIINIPR